MPSYKVKWSHLPSSLFHNLGKELLGRDDPGVGATDALRTVYGARPTVEFLRDACPTRREPWLGTSTGLRRRVPETLREACHRRGLPKGARTRTADLGSPRNATTLRETVLAELMASGESYRPDEHHPVTTIDLPPMGAPVRPREKITMSRYRPEQHDAMDGAGTVSPTGRRSSNTPESGEPT